MFDDDEQNVVPDELENMMDYLDMEEQFVDASDLIARAHTAIEKYGLSADMLEFIDDGGSFTSMTGVVLPAVENFTISNTYEVSVAVVEGLGDFFKSILEAIGNFFKKIFEWISNIFGGSKSSGGGISSKEDLAKAQEKWKKQLSELDRMLIDDRWREEEVPDFKEPKPLYLKKDIEEVERALLAGYKVMHDGVVDVEKIKVPNLNDIATLDTKELLKGIPEQIDISKEARSKIEVRHIEKHEVSGFKEAGWRKNIDVQNIGKAGDDVFRASVDSQVEKSKFIRKMKELTKIRNDIAKLSTDPKLSQHLDKVKDIQQYVHSLIRYISAVIRMKLSPCLRNNKIYVNALTYNADVHVKFLLQLFKDKIKEKE